MARLPKFRSEPVLGLVLLGGGARGAYQVGVIKALAEITQSRIVPFRVLSGVSVGALNILGIASSFSNFTQSAALVEKFWKSLNSERVFRASPISLFRTAFGLALSAVFPRFSGYLPHSLLNTSPLREALEYAVDLDKISRAIQGGHLNAVGLTSTSYRSGHSVTFFDGSEKIDEWRKVMRGGVRTNLTLDHGLASAGLPILFEAMKIGNEYYGDGMLSLTLPLAPSIHMGADRLVIVGTGNVESDVPDPDQKSTYPTLGDLGGFALDSIFQNHLDADIERITKVNELIKSTKPLSKFLSGLKQIDTFTINPSVSLDKLALKHVSEMPYILRWILRRQQSNQPSGQIESYLLFECGYISDLIDLGYADTMAKRQDIKKFLAR